MWQQYLSTHTLTMIISVYVTYVNVYVTYDPSETRSQPPFFNSSLMYMEEQGFFVKKIDTAPPSQGGEKGASRNALGRCVDVCSCKQGSTVVL